MVLQLTFTFLHHSFCYLLTFTLGSSRILRLPCKHQAHFIKTLVNGTLSVTPKRTFSIRSSTKCVKECLMFHNCKTFSIDSKARKCHLYDTNTTDLGVRVIKRERLTHYQTRWDRKKVPFADILKFNQFHILFISFFYQRFNSSKGR